MNARSSFMAIALVVGPMVGQQATAQQGVNNRWTMGYNGSGGSPEPFGGLDLDFITTNRVITMVDRWMDYGRTVANISDENGNLLFSTNGVSVANTNGDLMLNGGGLNPSWYTSQYSPHPSGLHLPQSCLVLPKPGTTGIYFLFHSTLDDPPASSAHYLYLTIIDMSLDGGLGGVVSKNQVLINDTLNIGRITAVRHANGRDWWIFCFKAGSNIHYRLLLTPFGVSVDGTQAMGEVHPPDNGQACFSLDGTRYAYYSGYYVDLELFDFDRCTGLFSNPVHVAIDDYNGMGGAAFSSSGRYLYAASTLDLYQFDTEADDMAASMVTIAHWDSTYSPSPPFASLFNMAQLAPDGKIYISTANSGLCLHVINAPDEPSLACNMEQHGVALPRLNMNSLPNHPNYFLGPVDGSVCDSLGINVGVRERLPLLTVCAYPNPSINGHFTLTYPAQPTVGELEIRDVAGRVVLQQRIPQWSTLHQVELAGQAAGMYQCKLTWANGSVATHIILER